MSDSQSESVGSTCQPITHTPGLSHLSKAFLAWQLSLGEIYHLAPIGIIGGAATGEPAASYKKTAESGLIG